ncbi:redoxin family protein [Flavobacteriaceae bacterium F08102]|nr:redoxin family protein [Flavobacteriaceae bacterium F08102]
MKNKRKLLSNILFGIFIVLLFIPTTRSWFIRVVSFSPSITRVDERQTLADYNWNLVRLDGKKVDFNEYKGKVVLVNFWATWCPSCLAEKPSLVNLYNQYKEKVDFLFISNESNEAIEKYYTKQGYDLPTYKSLSQPPVKIRSNAIPATYIIDKNGQLVVSKVGSADWDTQKVKTLLDDLIKS